MITDKVRDFGQFAKKHSSEHLRNLSGWILNLWPVVSLSAVQ